MEAIYEETQLPSRQYSPVSQPPTQSATRQSPSSQLWQGPQMTPRQGSELRQVPFTQTSPSWRQPPTLSSLAQEQSGCNLVQGIHGISLLQIGRSHSQSVGQISQDSVSGLQKWSPHSVSFSVWSSSVSSPAVLDPLIALPIVSNLSEEEVPKKYTAASVAKIIKAITTIYSISPMPELSRFSLRELSLLVWRMFKSISIFITRT